MRKAGLGEPPCPYALAVLGSAGRGESLLAMDQDNALVFAEGEPGGRSRSLVREACHPCRRHSGRGRRALLQGRRDGEEPAMARLARHLAGAGRRTGSSIRSRKTCWPSISSSTCAASTATARFRTPCGARRSTRRAGRPAFAKALAEAAGGRQTGLGIVRRHQDRAGTDRPQEARPVRHCHRGARCSPSAITSSSARRRRGLLGSRRWISAATSDLEALAEAQAVFLHFILVQQIDDIEHGRPASNAVVVKQLSPRDRERLRSALRAVEPVDDADARSAVSGLSSMQSPISRQFRAKYQRTRALK